MGRKRKAARLGRLDLIPANRRWGLPASNPGTEASRGTFRGTAVSSRLLPRASERRDDVAAHDRNGRKARATDRGLRFSSSISTLSEALRGLPETLAFVAHRGSASR